MSNLLGILFILLFLVLILGFALFESRLPRFALREIPAFRHLRRAIGLSVEAGKRIHVSLGRGSLIGNQAGAGFLGLHVLERVSRNATVADRPPFASSGEGALAILSQDTLKGSFKNLGMAATYRPDMGQLTGTTPLAFAAGAIPLIDSQQVSIDLLMGNFGSEAVLLSDASERKNNLLLAGSDDLAAQAVFFSFTSDSLLGEELFAVGAYLHSGRIAQACVRAQDILRWVLIAAILAGSLMKLAGL